MVPMKYSAGVARTWPQQMGFLQLVAEWFYLFQTVTWNFWGPRGENGLASKYLLDSKCRQYWYLRGAQTCPIIHHVWRSKRLVYLEDFCRKTLSAWWLLDYWRALVSRYAIVASSSALFWWIKALPWLALCHCISELNAKGRRRGSLAERWSW